MRSIYEDSAVPSCGMPSCGPYGSDDGAALMQSGSVEFFVGPSRGRNGSVRAPGHGGREQSLVDLAMVASAFGKTTLIDGFGGAVIFGDQSEDNIELF